MKKLAEQLCPGVQFMSMIEPKFKTSNLFIIMMLPAEPEKYAALSLAKNILLNSCAKYPSVSAMSEKMQDLYGASVSSSVGIIGNTWQVDFSASVISDRYALEGEKLCLETADLLLECLLHPNAENHAFNQTAFCTEQQEMLDNIESEINNKRSYAMKRAKEIIFQGEVNAYPIYGSREEVLALTPEQVYAAYQELLQKAQILIYYVGTEAVPELPEMFRKAFSGRTVQDLAFYAPSPCKSESAMIKEKLDVRQCQLIMAFKISETEQEVLRLCSLMFGGAPFSLLFSNVREKMSLCYYCSSMVLYGKNTMLVSSGVSPENIEKTRLAILDQLELLKTGQFDEKLLTDAKRYLINALRLSGDTPSSCITEEFECFIRKDHAGLEERIAICEKITKEDIIRTACALKQDSIYILEQEDNA